MSRLEQRIRAGEFVLTAELLTVNTGGLDAVHERFAPVSARSGRRMSSAPCIARAAISISGTK